MKTRLYRPTSANIRLLAKALRQGELVAIPTETVYGLAANALDARACRRIFTAKRRPSSDPLIVHVPNLREAEKLAEFNTVARALARQFWPGPLSLVLPKYPHVPAIVTANMPTIALRVPRHATTLRLLRAANCPLAAPSANLFTQVSPTTAEDVSRGLAGRIAHILKGRSSSVGVESTIVHVESERILRILRPGAISADDLYCCLKANGLRAKILNKRAAHSPLSPGSHRRHYSPPIPITLVKKIPKSIPPDTLAIFWRRPNQIPAINNIYFSQNGASVDAARNLYRVLHCAGASGYARALVELPPSVSRANGLGNAIKDRLTRAAAK